MGKMALVICLYSWKRIPLVNFLEMSFRESKCSENAFDRVIRTSSDLSSISPVLVGTVNGRAHSILRQFPKTSSPFNEFFASSASFR